MKKLFTTVLALACIACATDIVEPTAPQQAETSAPATRIIVTPNDDQIMLGQKLTNPYSLEIMNTAVEGLYGEEDFFDANYYYVRFLPEDSLDVNVLLGLDLELFDYPLDYEISGGEYYHDPSIPDGEPTWMYTVVPVNFQFTNISMDYEILEDCYIPEDGEPEDWGVGVNSSVGGASSINSTNTGNITIDLEEVERRAYIISGNGDMLDNTPNTRAVKTAPCGVVRVYDNEKNNLQPLKGATILANRFVKIATGTTDGDGFYEVNKSFNVQGNVIITITLNNNARSYGVYKTVSLAKHKINDISSGDIPIISIYPNTTTASANSSSHTHFIADGFFWSAATIFHAANLYYDYCVQEHISTPPADLRIVPYNTNNFGGSAPMLTHNTFHNTATYSYATLISLLLGGIPNLIVEIFSDFLPDVIISNASSSTEVLTGYVFHELAHASLFGIVGHEFWRESIDETVFNSLSNGNNLSYGDYESSQFTGLNELWAKYCEFVFKSKRFGPIDESDIREKLLQGGWIEGIVLYNISNELNMSLWEIFYAYASNQFGRGVVSLDELRQALIYFMDYGMYEQKVINYNFGYFFDRLNIAYHFKSTSPMAKFVVTKQKNNSTGLMERTTRFVDARASITLAPYPTNYSTTLGNNTITEHAHLPNFEYMKKKNFPFKEYAAVYDTNVMSMPLREFYERDSLNTFNHFFNKSSWKLKSVDSLNLTINYAYETDY